MTEGISLPEFQVKRGGMEFRQPTLEEIQAYRNWQETIRAVIENLKAQRNDAINQACAVGLANGWDIHVYEHPDLEWKSAGRDDYWQVISYIGIQYRLAKYGAPTLTFHREDASWTDDGDWVE